MKSTHHLAAILALALSAATPVAVAQEKTTKEGSAGKAAAAATTKTAKPAAATAPSATAAQKATAAPALSKPAATERAPGHGKDGNKSGCHDSASDA